MDIKKFTMQDALALAKKIQDNQEQLKKIGQDTGKQVAQVAVGKLSPEQLDILKQQIDTFDPQEFTREMRPKLEQKFNKSTVDLLEQVMKGDFSNVLTKVEAIQEKIGNVAESVTKNFGTTAGENFAHYAQMFTSGLLSLAMNAQTVVPKLLKKVPETSKTLNESLQKDWDAQQKKLEVAKGVAQSGSEKLGQLSTALHDKLYGDQVEKPETLTDFFKNTFQELEEALKKDKPAEAKELQPAAQSSKEDPGVEKPKS